LLIFEPAKSLGFDTGTVYRFNSDREDYFCLEQLLRQSLRENF
jgi:hypothetical protein